MDLIDVIEPQEGDNLLVSNYDRYYSLGDEFVSVVRIQERYGYMPIDCGYRDTVVVQGDRERLRDAVRRAFEYARARGLRVQINNKHVRDDIAAGILDDDGLVVIYGGASL